MTQKSLFARNVIICLMAVVMLILLLPAQVKAASIKIKYDGKTVQYTDQQVTYSINGTSISTTYPGIIINGISLAPCEAIFSDSDFGAAYSYSKTKGTITLKKGSTTILFTLGSTTAKVNGTAKKLPLAPRIITFSDSGKSVIYVPARFVTENMGCQYTWNSSTGNSNMTVPKVTAKAFPVKYDGKTVNYTDKKVLFSLAGETVTDKNAPGILIDGTIMISGKDLFADKRIGATYKYDSKTKKIIITNKDIRVTMVLNSKTAFINGVKQKLEVAPKNITYKETGKTYLCVPASFVAKALGYGYSYNSTQGIVSLTAPWYLKYDGSWTAYSGIRGKLTVNGLPISLSPMDSFMIDETLMVRAKAFADSLGCDYAFDSKNNTMTLSNETAEIIFFLNKNTATVNGEEKTIITSARKVVNGDNNTSYTMIPIRFAATTLGFNYSWDEKTLTSVVTSKTDGEDKPSTPEEIPDGTYFSWKPMEAFQSHIAQLSAISPQQQINYKQWDETAPQYSCITSVKQDLSAVSYLYDTFVLESPNSFYGISSEINAQNQLVLTFDHAVTVNGQFPFSNTVAAIKANVISNNTTMETSVIFELSVQSPTFELTISEDGKQLFVKIYRTCISGIEAGSKNNQDYIKFTATGTLEPTYMVDSSNPDLITVTIPGTIDTLGANSYQPEQSRLIQSIIYMPSDNFTQIVLYKTSSSDFSFQDYGSYFEIVFSEMAAEEYAFKIPFMASSDRNEIKDEDLYLKKQFRFTLPGDQTAYLNANPVINTSDNVSKVTTTLNSKGNTEVLITTKKLQAYRMHMTDNAILLEIDDPKNLYDKIVVLDAGHGGKDPGSQHNGCVEKALNLKIIYDLLEPMMQSSDIKAYWTRVDDTFVELKDRAKFASQVGADLFISLHMNAFTTAVPNGLSVFYSTANNASAKSGLTSAKLASLLQANLISGLKCTDRKVKTAQYLVTNQNTVPAVLIELGFISNPAEAKNLSSLSYQKSTAQILFDSMSEVFQKYPTGR